MQFLLRCDRCAACAQRNAACPLLPIDLDIFFGPAVGDREHDSQAKQDRDADHYPGGLDVLQNAVRRYRRALGSSSTGAIEGAELDALNRDEEAIDTLARFETRDYGGRDLRITSISTAVSEPINAASRRMRSWVQSW